MDFEPISISKNIKEYWEGHSNKLIRLWTYAQRGLQLINEFKYLVAGLLAGYVILKLTNPLWMIIVGLATLPVIILIGRWQLRKVAKVSEWVGAIYGSVIGYNSYNIQIEQLKLLKEINKKLDKLNGGEK